MLRAREQGERAIAREVLGDVHVLAAAVVALARQALGVLVGEPRALRLEHGGVDVVLARDQLDLVRLAMPLLLHRGPQLRVHVRDRRPGRRRDGARRGGLRGGCRCDGDFGHGRTSWRRDAGDRGWPIVPCASGSTVRPVSRRRHRHPSSREPFGVVARHTIQGATTKPRRHRGWSWTSENSSSERCEAIMTPSPRSPACSSRGWTRRPA